MSDHFVGRDAELDTLDELLVRARAGAPHVVLLVGEPGIGKTTLIDGFLRRHRDVTSLRAGGDDSEMLYSYGIVRQLAASAGPAGLELAGTRAVHAELQQRDGPRHLVVRGRGRLDQPLQLGRRFGGAAQL
ncbi:MAG TPA: ATP-binding protein, partial [Nakamurella multipartita]|nr:ATP-binding protein [Nakamurella multipartita]